MAAQEQPVPKIVLIPHARSHPFAQRECILTEPLKVGRPVDKKKISQNNLIFDCRVLSRNHALIWFENGKFFIRDTKSSNGTFVNECRLSPSGEESSPTEMKTRDIVQFGVNVNVEKKVTHGCIIATIKLFINEKELPGPDPDIQQVMAVVQNALLHEQEVETKLACMQEVLVAAHNLTKDSMISIVKEDELLSRLEMLENQLQVYSRNVTEDELRKQLTKSLEEKHKRELAAKETIQKMLQEKIDTTSKLSQLQRDYDKAEEECQRYRTLYESLKHEHSQQVSKLNEIVKTAEKQKNEEEDKNKEERQIWIASKESLQVELDMTRNELDVTRLRLKETNEELLEIKSLMDAQADTKSFSKETETNTSRHENVSLENGELIERGVVEEMITETIKPILSGNTEERGEEARKSADEEHLKDQLKASEEKVNALSGEIVGLNKASKSMQRQIEELKAQLEDKSILEQNKSRALSDMKETIEYQRSELEKLRSQIAIKRQQSDITDLPSDLEQCQAQLVEVRRRSEDMEKRLKDREQEMDSVLEDKKRLEEKVKSLDADHNHLIDKSRQKETQLQNELLEVQNEAKSLTTQLHVLQDTLADSMANSLSSSFVASSSSEVSLLEGPPTPDPRLRVLSVITLVSIAIAIISSAFAYFF